MIRLILVRHALTDWNLEERCHGVTDVPLGEHGIGMANSLVERLSDIPFDEVYCSDLQRAVMTMEIVLNGRTPPIHADARLRERNFGKMEGNTHAQGLQLWPQEVSAWLQDHTYTMEGGESFEDFNSRVTACLEDILTLSDGKTVLIVAHGGSLRSLLRSLGERFGNSDLDIFMTHACYSDLCIDAGKLDILEFNVCDHLSVNP